MLEKTIPELIENRVKKHGVKLLFQRREGWSWKQITWLDFDEQVKNIASYLMHLGLAEGDKVVIASANGIEAIATEVAVYHLGGIVVPLCGDGSLKKIVSTANELEAKFIFIGRELQPILDFYREMSLLANSSNGLPKVEKTIFFHNIRVKDDKITNFQTVLKYGFIRKKSLRDKLTEVSKKLDSSLTAAIFLTNDGTKRISQGDLIKALDRVSQRSPSITIEDQVFSYMPYINPFSRLINYLTLYKSSMACTAESRDDFYQNILEVKPSIIFEIKEGVERIYERSLLGLNGNALEKKLRKDLGGRVKYLFTDQPPSEQVQKAFKSVGITFYLAQDLNNLAT